MAPMDYFTKLKNTYFGHQGQSNDPLAAESLRPGLVKLVLPRLLHHSMARTRPLRVRI